MSTEGPLVLQRIVPTLVLLSACGPASAESQAEPAGATAPAEPDAVRRSGPAHDGTAEADKPEPKEPDALPPGTAQPLTLLATLAGTEARATIRDDEAGTIASYRVGETVRSEVVVASIDELGVVLTETNGATHLGFSDAPAQMSADDVFYPDLAHFDDLPHSMADAVQLEDGPGYTVKAPAYAWGTPRSVAAVKEAMRAYGRAHPKAPAVYVGDLSKKGGGPFPPHLSHQSGRDVDIGFVHQGRAEGARRFVRGTAGNLDLQRTWDLLDALLGTGQVAYVFVDYGVQGLLVQWATQRGINPAVLEERFQYPRGRGAAHGLVRHWKGHDDHLHVRFKQ